MMKVNKGMKAGLAAVAGMLGLGAMAGAGKAADLGGAKGPTQVTQKAGPQYYAPKGDCRAASIKDSCWAPEVTPAPRVLDLGFMAGINYGELSKGHNTFETMSFYAGLKREMAGTDGALSWVGVAEYTTSLKNAMHNSTIVYDGPYAGYEHHIGEERDYDKFALRGGIEAKVWTSGPWSLSIQGTVGPSYRQQKVTEDIQTTFNGTEVDRMIRESDVSSFAIDTQASAILGYQVDEATKISATANASGAWAIGRGDDETGLSFGMRMDHRF